MINGKDKLFEVEGERLREIRKELCLTMTTASKETGISRNSIADFENGYKMPASKYMIYLHNKHNVNLNYIFGGEKRKFRLGTGDNPPDFGSLQGLVYSMLRFMDGSAYVCFSILAYAAKLRKDRQGQNL